LRDTVCGTLHAGFAEAPEDKVECVDCVPPSNGWQTEWVNQNIEQYLCIFTNFLQDDWADWLTLTKFNHNDQVSKTTGFSPLFMTMGFHLQKGTEPCLEVPTEDASKFATRMSKVRKEVGAAMRAVQETMKRFYDAK
jgi:hypothetical protein